MSRQDGTWQPPTAEDAQAEEADQAENAAEDGTPTGTDPEALDHEREEYPDPESYPTPEEGEEQLWNGETPDADLQVGAEEG